MAREKQKVDSLPCGFNHIYLVFWGSIGLACISSIISYIIIAAMGIQASSLIWLPKSFGLAGTICGFIFMYYFAKGCRAVNNSLYCIYLLMAILSLLSSIVTFFIPYLSISLTNLSTFIIVAGIIALVTLVLYIIATIIICLNFSGILGDIGKAQWRVPLIMIGIILIIALISSLPPDFAALTATMTLIAAIYFIYLLFSKILLPMKDLLENGEALEALQEYGLQVYTDEEPIPQTDTEATSYDTMGTGYGPSEFGRPSLGVVEPVSKNGGLTEAWNRLSSTMKFLVVTIAVILISLAGYGVYSGIHNSDKYQEEYSDGEDENEYENVEIVSESEEEEVIEEAEEEYGDSPEEWIRPDWVPEKVIDIFGKYDLSLPESTSSYRDFFRSSQVGMGDTGKYTGTFGEYPIAWEMSIQNNGDVTGRYAYKSTLEKYGDKPNNWFKITGNLVFDNEMNTYMLLQTYHPETRKTFEYALLEYTPYGDQWRGRLFNKRYIDNPNDKFYHINIKLSE